MDNKNYISEFIIYFPKNVRSSDKHPPKTPLPKSMPKTSRKEKKARRKNAAEAFRIFDEDLTFLSFYALCDIVRKADEWQCADSLQDAGYKIPTPELKKILEFITTEGKKRKWTPCEFSVHIIIESHHCNNSWRDMDDERLECLLPYLDDEFWCDLSDRASMRNAKDMSIKDLRTVFNIILKPQLYQKHEE